MDLMPNEVVQQKLFEIAEKHFGTKEFTKDIVRGTEKGDNYIGIIHKAKFCLKCKNNINGNNNNDNSSNNNCDDTTNCLELIVKVPPSNKIRREKFFARPAFIREAEAYNEVLPMFMKFQQSKGIIPSEDGFHHIAPCLGTIIDDMDEAIILKDLTKDDFEMYNRHNYITLEHTYLVMKILGKFHAISYAMKDQCPEQFEKYKLMEDLIKTRDDEPEMANYMTMIKNRAVATLDPEKHKDYIEKIDKLFESITVMDLFVELTAPKDAEPYAVINHGDCWNNNFLYKYKDGKLIEARLIDWQMMRYASPVCDLMYFLFLGTSREMRSKHYKEFIDIYHESLSTFMTRLGSNPTELFPREALDDQLKRFGKFGFVTGCMLTPILTTYAEDIPDLDDVSKAMENRENLENAFKSTKSEGAYQERMSGIILDMFEFGYM